MGNSLSIWSLAAYSGPLELVNATWMAQVRKVPFLDYIL